MPNKNTIPDMSSKHNIPDISNTVSLKTFDDLQPIDVNLEIIVLFVYLVDNVAAALAFGCGCGLLQNFLYVCFYNTLYLCYILCCNF